MRVTNRMMVNAHQRNMNRSLGNLHRVENQIISKRMVNRPSDNPVNAARIMGFQNQISRNEQLNRNLESALDVTNAADTALGQINDQLLRIQDLTQQAANGTQNEAGREAIANEIEELTNAIVQFMNATHVSNLSLGEV